MKNRTRQNMRRNRKNRKSTRKNTRKNRQNTRKRMNSRAMNTRRNNMMYGGMRALTPMELTDMSMEGPTKQSVAQGVDFFGYHAKQHGGMAPVGSTGVLDDTLRTYARLAPLDKSFTEIVGMRDQAGGKRKKGRKGKKGRKSTRKMRGGAMPALNPMETSASGTLLPSSLQRVALSTMSPEWKLAENPNSFAPRM